MARFTRWGRVRMESVEQRYMILAPKNFGVNAHLSMLYGLLTDNGFEVVEFSIFQLLRPKKKIWHIHWINRYLRGTVISLGIVRPYTLISIARMLCFFGLLAVAKTLKTKVIWTVHNVEMHSSANSVLEIFFTKQLLRRVDRVTTFNHYIKSYLETHYSAQDVHIMRQGRYESAMTPEAVTPQDQRKRFGVNDGDFVLLFFGNLMHYKGVDLAVEAVKSIGRSNVKLIIAGSSKNEPEYGLMLRELSTGPGSEGIILLDEFISDDEIPGLFGMAHYAIYPYRKISNSGVLFMAIQFLKPTIIADKGGIGEIFDEYGGLGILMADSNVESIKVAILDSISGERDAYSENLKKAYEDLSWENLTDEIVSCFVF
jgi:beta-1,4-mannosyltransferase